MHLEFILHAHPSMPFEFVDFLLPSEFLHLLAIHVALQIAKLREPSAPGLEADFKRLVG